MVIDFIIKEKIMKATILTFTSLLLLSTTACAVVNEGADSNKKTKVFVEKFINKKQIKDQQASKEVIAKVPVQATIKNGRDEIDFLSNTTIVKETQSQKNYKSQNANKDNKVFLRTINGKSIYYDKNNVKKLSGARVSQEIITYNKRRKLVGVFSGVINVEVADKNQINNITNDYNLDVIIVVKRYATLKIKDLNNSPTIIKNMKADARIKKITLKIKEDEIVKH
jgi:hypothetical protein